MVRFASLRPAQDIEADFACPFDLNEPPVVSVFAYTPPPTAASLPALPMFVVLDVVAVWLVLLLRLVPS